MDTLEIDGAMGEGGGQVLRSALALSVITRRAVRFTRIRANRRKPGLARQHLTAVRAAATISGAKVTGVTVGSTVLTFEPAGVYPGHHRFAVGTAGSTTLVLQTILWPLLCADEPSVLTIEGGTHNPLAPTFDFLDRTLAPVLRRMGAELTLTLHRHGFYPAGGGRIEARLSPSQLVPLQLLERGPIRRRQATAIVAQLPVKIANRELGVVKSELLWTPEELRAERVDSDGPGNVITLELEHDATTTVVTAIGAKGVPAERVATTAIEELRRFEAADVPVDEHLADQLLLPLALAGGGTLRTLPPTLHTRTNAALIELFLPVKFTLRELEGGAWQVAVSR
jgi:RNA 3'-terminal phosphate cyclase (ATP)